MSLQECASSGPHNRVASASEVFRVYAEIKKKKRKIFIGFIFPNRPKTNEQVR